MASVLRVLFAALMTVSLATLASAQQTGAPNAAAQTQVEGPQVIRQILVEGNQRVEADTVLSYLLIQPGQVYDTRLVNLSIQTLIATGLFSDVQFEDRGQIVVVRVQENPIINRVILEGNNAIDDEKITDEIEAQPRAIFTRPFRRDRDAADCRTAAKPCRSHLRDFRRSGDRRSPDQLHRQ